MNLNREQFLRASKRGRELLEELSGDYPDLKLYCGDVQIEYRCGVLRHESIRRLQQDPRLPPELNAVGNIRVVAGSLEGLSNVE